LSFWDWFTSAAGKGLKGDSADTVVTIKATTKTADMMAMCLIRFSTEGIPETSGTSLTFAILDYTPKEVSRNPDRAANVIGYPASHRLEALIDTGVRK
jgi:hypothetical protein